MTHTGGDVLAIHFLGGSLGPMVLGPSVEFPSAKSLVHPSTGHDDGAQCACVLRRCAAAAGAHRWLSRGGRRFPQAAAGRCIPVTVRALPHSANDHLLMMMVTRPQQHNRITSQFGFGVNQFDQQGGSSFPTPWECWHNPLTLVQASARRLRVTSRSTSRSSLWSTSWPFPRAANAIGMCCGRRQYWQTPSSSCSSSST